MKKFNKQLKYLIIFALLLSVFTGSLQAQVTIGSLLKPIDGALLQLTEGDVTTKGLLLPRVKLTTLDRLDDINPGASARPDVDMHVGLTVYNVPNDEVCPTIETGVYVWLGTKWMKVGAQSIDFLYKTSKNIPAGIIIEKDQEGNSFAAASFGEAGVWMLHNLAVTKYADGTPIPVYDGTPRRTAAAYSYPNVVPGDWGKAPTTYKREQGLLYTWGAATKGYNPGNLNQTQYTLSGVPGVDEVENVGPGGIAPDKYVQGACPNGWHLPSDREWNELAKETYSSPLSYSNYMSGEAPFAPPWNAGWEIGITGYRGAANGDKGQGAVLKEACTLNYFLGLPPTNGRSLSLDKNGFNGKLVGLISADKVFNFGLFAYFWTSSAYSTDRAWFRYLNFNSPAGGRNSEDKGDLLSVRCKKN